MVLSHRIFITRDNSTGFTIVWGKVNGTISQKPSANFARTFSVVHSAVISKCSNLGNASAININSISNSAISVYGYQSGNGSVNYIVFGFSQTRDNSTGFTIQWGVCGGDTTANWPRRFASVLSFSACEKTGAWLVSTVSAVTNTNFYLHGRAQAYFMAFGFTQSRDNSTGFTIQWGKNEISGYGYTTINFPRSFNVIYAMARSDYRASKGEGTSGHGMLRGLILLKRESVMKEAIHLSLQDSHNT